MVKQLEAKLTPSGLAKRMLSDGTYEELPQTEGNDPNACAFEKMVPGTDEGILPEVRFREQRLALYVVKKVQTIYRGSRRKDHPGRVHESAFR